MYENYCKIRDALKLKDADVSKGANVPKSTFSDWKVGRSVPKTDKLIRIATFLGVSLEQLMSGNIEWDPETQEMYVVDDYETEYMATHALKNAAKEYYANEETNNVAEKIRTNKELSMLFDAAQDSSPEDIMAVYGMLLALKKK